MKYNSQMGNTTQKAVHMQSWCSVNLCIKDYAKGYAYSSSLKLEKL